MDGKSAEVIGKYDEMISLDESGVSPLEREIIFLPLIMVWMIAFLARKTVIR